MRNTAVFGQAMRRQRGTRSQVAIAERGGPYRQFQARIERGDDIELSAAVLNKYDNAFGWAAGTSITILQGTQADGVTVTPPDLTEGILGHDAASGRPINFPRHLRTTLDPTKLIPAITAWPGIAVVDTQVFDVAERKPTLKTAINTGHRTADHWANYPSRTGPTIDHLVTQWKAASAERTVLGVGVLTDQTDRVAIDPIAALTSSDEAFPLINAVNGIHTTIPHSIDYQIVWTLIFLAAQRPPARTARAVLTVEAPLLAPDDPLFQPFEYSWAEFFPQGSMWFEPRTDDAASLFAGLTAARNESVTVHLDKSTTPANLIHKGPKVVLPQELPTGTLMLHNADVSPELPAVIAWATKEPVLIITRGPAPKLAGSPSKLSVIETVPPRDSGSAEAPKDAGTALLTHIADTAHPLLTFADDEEQPANVVLTTSKRVALPD